MGTPVLRDLDHGEDEAVGRVLGVDDLATADRDGVGALDPALDLYEVEVAGIGLAALDVVALVVVGHLLGLAVEDRVHDDPIPTYGHRLVEQLQPGA